MVEMKNKKIKSSLKKKQKKSSSRTICLKNPEGYFLRNVSHWLNSTAKETSCKVLRRLTKVRKILVFKLGNYATPV